MAESPRDLHRRAAGDLRMPPVAEWDTFPFDGDLPDGAEHLHWWFLGRPAGLTAS